MYVVDKFGNLRLMGGDVVDVNLCLFDGKYVVVLKVDDYVDGTYGVKFKFECLGMWEI